ncbi:lysine transporter LysE [Chromobacterium haemolyticum]|uniref:LysE family translocator n=1 Tax=Chromobacterium haemolyticum TaxID=394935 RepID=UPI0009D9C5A0|nr:LysE family translocator [Chromobacterium haemolyticum]OQS35964.1 lysine transporter LysE [Chromobacterium haemolyticum]
MQHYPLYLLMAAATVVSPGPGILMTLTNSLHFGLRGTMGGILGTACGSFIVAGVSATSLGLLLAASALAFTVMKWIGAAYLFYLGVKLLLAPAFRFDEIKTQPRGFARRFGEGMAVQLTNPKSIFFFLSIFPQFIDTQGAYAPQFLLLVGTFSSLIILIHTVYALTAQRARRWLASERGGKWVNKAGGMTFLLFGALLANANK